MSDRVSQRADQDEPDVELSARQVEVRAVRGVGALPPPDVFRQYEEVLDGAAERIMSMIEAQADHRMEMERALVEGAVRTERLGQIFGLAIVLLAFGVSAWLIENGHPVSGTILGVTDLIGLVVVFARRGDSGADGS